MTPFRSPRTAVAVALVAALTLALSWQPGQAQVTKGKTRTAETKYLMRGVVQAHCAGLGKLLKDGPADDKAWDTAACHASILNELSYTLMDDGRCPSKEWAGAAKTLRECSAKVLEAAAAKDTAAAQASFKALTKACATCHTAHKGK